MFFMCVSTALRTSNVCFAIDSSFRFFFSFWFIAFICSSLFILVGFFPRSALSSNRLCDYISFFARLDNRTIFALCARVSLERRITYIRPMLSHIENTSIYSYTQIKIAYDRRKNTSTRTHAYFASKSAEHETSSSSNETLNDVDDRDNVVDKKIFTRCQDDDGKPKS